MLGPLKPKNKKANHNRALGDMGGGAFSKYL